MNHIIRQPSARIAILIGMALLCWFALGCGLFDDDRSEAAPTPEPDIAATVQAAVERVESTGQAEATANAPTPATHPGSTSELMIDPTASPGAFPSPGSPAEVEAALSAAGPDPLWSDVFDALTETERSCLRNDLGDEGLALALGSPIRGEGDTQHWEVSVLKCLAPDTAPVLYRFNLFAQLGQEIELTEQHQACIGELLNGVDIPALVAASLPDATPDQVEPLYALTFGLFTCAPELAAMESGTPPGGPAAHDESRLWSYATQGWVSAAPTVADGVVYVGSNDHRVYALDAATGNELWSFATGDVVVSVPTVVDGVVYVGSNDNHLHALDADTGEKLWSYDTGSWVQYSPAVSGGKVYLGARVDGNNRVVALDAQSGSVVWTAQEPRGYDAEPAPAAVGNLVYTPGDEYGEFHALDAATGRLAWSAPVSSYVASAPTVLDGTVYLTVVNTAYALDESTGEVIWSYGTERYPAQDFPALVVDGVYYLSPDQYLHALDATTGDVLWTYEAPGFNSAAPVVADGVIYGAVEGGHVFALDTTTGAERWTLPTESWALQSLSVADGVLYAESDLGSLMAIDASDGAFIRDFQTGYILGVRLYTVSDGVVYVSSLPSGVQAYPAPMAR